MPQNKDRKHGFSLVELVVVVVIIGILAAIAIPRLSRGASGASESALAMNLSTMRSAISLYSAEHNGAFPGADAAGFENKLTLYSNLAGTTQATKSVATGFKFGPYLLAIPPCPVGQNAGKTTAADVLIDSGNSPPVPVPGSAGGEGWVYNANTGEILPNTDQSDEAGKTYATY